jgi:hypothetical protein
VAGGICGWPVSCECTGRPQRSTGSVPIYLVSSWLMREHHHESDYVTDRENSNEKRTRHNFMKLTFHDRCKKKSGSRASYVARALRCCGCRSHRRRRPRRQATSPPSRAHASTTSAFRRRPYRPDAGEGANRIDAGGRRRSHPRSRRHLRTCDVPTSTSTSSTSAEDPSRAGLGATSSKPTLPKRATRMGWHGEMAVG